MKASQAKKIPVYSSPLPFSNSRIKSFAAPGDTIKKIVDDLIPLRLAGAVGAIVMINGQIVPMNHWASVRPKLGTTININVIPMGGGGKKNPLSTILTIAVLIAAPYAGAALAGAMGITSTVGIAMVTAGVAAIGNLAVSALAPPPKPSNSGNFNGNAAESPTQFIEGARNDIAPYGVVPVYLGTNRVFPFQAAKGYTETKDNDQYVRQLVTWGYGKGVLTNIQIGDTPIEQFSDVELEHKLNGDLNTTTAIYPNDVNQTDYNVLLSSEDGYTVRATDINVNEAIIDFTFPQGLAFFNKEGKRVSANVELEMQYAPTGTPEDSPLWSPGASNYKDFAGANVAIPEASMLGIGRRYYGYRRDIIYIDKYSGAIGLLKGAAISTTANAAKSEILPGNGIRLATVVVWTRMEQVGSVNTKKTDVVSFSDDRDPALVGNLVKLSTDFKPTLGGLNVNVTAGSIKINDLNITESQTEALRRSVRVVFPTPGQYDIRSRRITADNSSDQFVGDVYLTAIRTIKNAPPVKLAGISGTAILMRATDQLNGAVDQLNGIWSILIPDYDPINGTWEERVTSNPASIYRWVLQGEANAKPLPDSRLDLAAIEDWWIHCSDQGYTYNRGIDFESSLEDTLADVASAGAASPAVVDGKRSIAIDRIKSDIVQIITPRNSSNYSAELIYKDVPHALRVQFRNKDKGFQQDERIVYRDGYNEDGSNGLIAATDFEVLELQYCTDTNLAYKTAKRHFAAIILRPESHSVNMDFENLIAIRGDRVKLAHDVPIVGVGDGRIKSFTSSDTGLITGITIDDIVSIPDSNTMFYTRIRLSDGTQLYKQVNTSIGEMQSFTFVQPFPHPLDSDDNELEIVGDLAYVIEAGGELDVIITKIEPQEDFAAKITAIDYAPEIFTAESSPIPEWQSRITEPLEFRRPLSPELIEIQSNEDVMLQNSDGSFTPRAIITLKNNNESDIQTSVKVRVSGTDTFNNANILELSPERIILTGLDDNVRYDIHIRYYRKNGVLQSAPLELNGYLFIGASGKPATPQNFKITVTGENALFKWDNNTEVDLFGYIMEYSAQFSGVTWATAQVIEGTPLDPIRENRITLPFLAGTYLLKAVDRQGNVSDTAAMIITYDPGNLLNAIATITEDPDFDGVKDNAVISGGGVVIADTDIPEAYYYFDNDLDLDGVFDSFVSAAINANGVFINDFFDLSDVFSSGDITGGSVNNIFDQDNFFEMGDVFGIGTDAWEIELQYRITQEDPVLDNWTDWDIFNAGYGRDNT